MIKISVIVAIFNVSKYLEQCLTSIVNQSYKELEIICVNDGSTDNSLDIINSFAKKDNRIKVVDRINGGLSAARNSGLAIATGDFVAFVDGDDRLDKFAYEKIVKCINNEIDIIWFEPQIVYEDYKIFKYWNKSDKDWYDLKYSGNVYLTDDIYLKSDCNVWNKVIRLEKIKKYSIEFPEGMLYEDAVFCYNLFLTTKRAYFLKEKLYIYYRRDGSIMNDTMNKVKNHGIYHIFILDYIYKYWKENGFLEINCLAFQKICAKLFRDGFNSVEKYEKVLVIWEMTKRLHEWNLKYEFDSILRILNDGTYKIIFPTKKRIHKFKGLQNIFCIKKDENLLRSIFLFKRKILSFK